MPSRKAAGKDASTSSGSPSTVRPSNVNATFIAVAGGSVHGIAVSTNGSMRVISARAFGTSTIRSHRYAAAGIV